MRSYTLFFIKGDDRVPTFEVVLFADDQDALEQAPRLSRQRTDCSAVEIWEDERLVSRLFCPLEPRSWASPR